MDDFQNYNTFVFSFIRQRVNIWELMGYFFGGETKFTKPSFSWKGGKVLFCWGSADYQGGGIDKLPGAAQLATSCAVLDRN